MFRTQVRHVFKKEMAQLLRNREAMRILLVVPFLLLGVPFYLTRRHPVPAPFPSRVTVETHH